MNILYIIANKEDDDVLIKNVVNLIDCSDKLKSRGISVTYLIQVCSSTLTESLKHLRNKRYESYFIIRNDVDVSIYDGWNKAIEYTKSLDVEFDLIGFLGCSDVPNPDFIFEAAKYTSPLHIQHFFGDYIRYKEEGLFQYIAVSSNPRIHFSNYWDFDICHSGSLYSASIFQQLDFDKNLYIAGDLEFHLRLRNTYNISALKLCHTQVQFDKTGVSNVSCSKKLLKMEYKKISVKRNEKVKFSLVWRYKFYGSMIRNFIRNLFDD